jgi:hypothetical protein
MTSAKRHLPLALLFLQVESADPIISELGKKKGLRHTGQFRRRAGRKPAEFVKPDRRSEIRAAGVKRLNRRSDSGRLGRLLC